MTPDYVAAIAVVGWGVTALWGLHWRLTGREERHARIVAEVRAQDGRQAPRDRPLVIPKVSLAEKTDRPHGALESDPEGTATTGMLALSAPADPGPDATEELVLGALPPFLSNQPPFPDPPPVDDGWIALTPEAFEPVRALPTPTLINPARST